MRRKRTNTLTGGLPSTFDENDGLTFWELARMGSRNGLESIGLDEIPLTDEWGDAFHVECKLGTVGRPDDERRVTVSVEDLLTAQSLRDEGCALDEVAEALGATTTFVEKNTLSRLEARKLRRSDHAD